MRISEEEIVFLSEFKWWERDEAWLKDKAALFENVGDLMRAAREKEI